MKIYNLVPYEANQPGRLTAEYARDKQAVVLKIFEQINRSALIMGINVDAHVAKHNAVEAIGKIKTSYPHAHIDDVCLAIKMGAFGEIKLENQLNTLSASNIFQWYKEFRLNHQDKMVSPPPAPKPYITDPDEDVKKTIARMSFEKFISDVRNNDLIIEIHFDVLLKIGLELSNEEKRKVFNQQMEKLVNNPPIEFYTNKKSREQVRELQTYWDSLEDKDKYDYPRMSYNIMHKQAVRDTKKTIAIKYVGSMSKEEIMAKYDAIH